MTECQLTRKLCDLFRRCNARVFVCVGGNVQQTAGWPDRYVAHTYFCGWIEFKSRTGQPSTAQKLILQKLGREGLIGRFLNDEFIQFELIDGTIVLKWRLGWTSRDAAAMLGSLGEAKEQLP